MVIAKVSVSGTVARATYRGKIPQGIVGATVEFDYTDPMWAGLKKTVIFWSSSVKDIPDVGESVKVPPEVVSNFGCRLRVGIYGVDLEGNTVIPTLWADLGPVEGSANPGIISGGTDDPISLEHLQTQIGDLSKLQTKSKESLVAAINELAGALSADLTGVVKSVNGVKPDAKGNVEIELGGDVTDEQIAQAVVDYLTKNPVEGGMTKTEKDLILSLFRNAAYTSPNMSSTLTQLESLWNGGEAPDEPDEPVVTLTRISATYSGGSVPVGTAVSALTGIVVTAHYSDGSSKTVTGYSLSGTIAEGSNVITVSYGGKTTTFTVTGVAEEPEEPDVPVEPEVTLTSISATYSGGSVPIGTAVNSLTGVVVTAHYSNGTSATVVGYTLSGTIAEGNNTITVTYEGKTATFVVVGANVLTSISAVYSGGSVAVGTALSDLTGVVVTAHYPDGSTATVTEYTLSGTIAEGGNTITVRYGGKTTTFTVVGVAVVSNETTWTSGVDYSFEPIPDEYPNSSGAIQAYNSWERTPYLYCEGASILRITALLNTTGLNKGNQDNCFYDSEKKFVRSFAFNDKIGESEPGTYVDITIPGNAAYVIVSGVKGNLSAPRIKLTPYE